MSATGEAKARRDARASGAKPRPEGRVREHVAAADALMLDSRRLHVEAAGRRAIARGRRSGAGRIAERAEAAA